MGNRLKRPDGRRRRGSEIGLAVIGGLALVFVAWMVFALSF